MKLSTGFSVLFLAENLKKKKKSKKPYIECQHIEYKQLVSIMYCSSIIMMMNVIIAAANPC